MDISGVVSLLYLARFALILHVRVYQIEGNIGVDETDDDVIIFNWEDLGKSPRHFFLVYLSRISNTR